MMSAKEMFEEQRYKRNEENEKITYLQRFGSGYFRITFDLSEKEIAIDTNMENVIESDLLQAIIQQVKELHWLDEKVETNYEHYKDKIIEDGIWNLALVNGKLKRCHNVYCNDCDFKTSHECKKKLEEWLNKPYEKPKYKLTQFEYDLLSVHKDYKTYNNIANQIHLFKMREKGYFKDIGTNIPIREILDNCEVEG